MIRAPSAVCLASTSEVLPTSVIRSPSSTTVPSNTTSASSFMVTTVPFLMMMRSRIAFPPCASCFGLRMGTLLGEVEYLAAENCRLAKCVKGVLYLVERVPGRDWDGDRAGRRQLECIVQVLPGSCHGRNQRGLGQDELDRVNIQHLVRVTGGYEPACLGQAPHPGGHRLGGPDKLKEHVSAATFGELAHLARQRLIARRMGNHNAISGTVVEGELPLLGGVGDRDHARARMPGGLHDQDADTTDAIHDGRVAEA